MRRITSYLLTVVTTLAVLLGTSSMVAATTTDTTTYGSGSYGGCDYGACAITLSGGGTKNANVSPTPTGSCTVQSDTVSVLTDSASGYTLTMTTSTTDNRMAGTAGTIAASSGTAASPLTLAVNSWGYRVDGLSGFGSGPTSSQSSGSTPSVPFAGVPASNGTPTSVAYSSGPANPAQSTTIWYGICANATVTAGSYSVSVMYTAVTN